MALKKTTIFFKPKKMGELKKKMGACWVHDGCNKKNPEKGPSTHKNCKNFRPLEKYGRFFFQNKKMGGKWTDGWRAEKRPFF